MPLAHKLALAILIPSPQEKSWSKGDTKQENKLFLGQPEKSSHCSTTIKVRSNTWPKGCSHNWMREKAFYGVCPPQTP